MTGHRSCRMCGRRLTSSERAYKVSEHDWRCYNNGKKLFWLCEADYIMVEKAVKLVAEQMAISELREAG